MRRYWRVTPSKKEALAEAKRANASFKERKLDLEAVVVVVSQRYAKKLTRPGYPLAKKHWGIYSRRRKK